MRTLSRLSALLPALGLSSLLGAQNDFRHWESPHVHPLDLAPDGTRLAAVNTGDQRLELFDLTGPAPVLVQAVPVGVAPVSVRFRTSTEAWVVNHVSDSVSVVDLPTGRVRATLRTDDEPADVVFAGAPQRAFVSCSQANTLLVFDPANLAAAPTRVELGVQEPRALATSADGSEVYVAVFESGNGTTLVASRLLVARSHPPDGVSDPAGPYAGVNPPPNDGVVFDPPLAPGLPTPPIAGQIVKKSAGGAWLDDNGADWAEVVSGANAAVSGRPVGWDLLDRDVAIVDTSTLAVTYAGGMVNVAMGLAVHPGTGFVTLVGTDALNHVRFEPNLAGRFLRVNLGAFDPAVPGTTNTVELNDHLDYTVPSVAQALRDRSLSDPRGIAWRADGSKGLVTGMGTNNLVVVDGAGNRAGAAPTIEVGEGPTGVVVDEARGRAYVLNKFEASVSVVDLTSETETARVSFFDPTPAVVRAGRRHLYGAHERSGTGAVACASCHLDGRQDRLAWDLGDPSGSVKPVVGQNVSGSPYDDWHPMKGPMLTQTLQDIIGKEPLHWRGDRASLEEFNPSFQSLLGDDEQLTGAEMAEFKGFLATLFYPPNPFRNLDNSLSTDVELKNQFTNGAFGEPVGQPLPNGDAANGRALFRPPNFRDFGVACSSCHNLPAGMGSDTMFVPGIGFLPIPPGPNGERHHTLRAGDFNFLFKIPHFRDLYERTGFDTTQTVSVNGFGYSHNGSVGSLSEFVGEPGFMFQNTQEVADMIAFLLSFSGEMEIGDAGVFEPPGSLGRHTHAAVGVQVTIENGAAPDPAKVAVLDVLVAEADEGDIGLVAKGRLAGASRGWTYLGGGLFQSDRRSQTHTRAALQALAAAGGEITFTAVAAGTQRRMGIDRDRDNVFDYDEILAGTDPADPDDRPRLRVVPPGQRP